MTSKAKNYNYTHKMIILYKFLNRHGFDTDYTFLENLIVSEQNMP